MKVAVLTLTILALTTTAFAEQKDNTDPILTCGIIGQLVQDAALCLGPLYQKPVKAFSPAPEIVERPRARREVVSRTREVYTKTTTTTVKQDDASEDQTPKTYKFKGEQMWGNALVKVVTDENSFDCKVECTLPVIRWTVFADDSQIASKNISNQTVFQFVVKEPYNPPYQLVLNIIYMGMPNQIKVDLK